MCIPGNSQSRIKYTFQECYESLLTDKVAAFFRWTFGIVVGIVALISLVLEVRKIRRNHCGNQYNQLRNEGRLAMGEFNASSQSLVMNIPNSNF